MKRRRIGGYIDWVDVVMQRVRPGSFLSFTLRYGGHGSLPNVVEVFRPRARAYTTRVRKLSHSDDLKDVIGESVLPDNVDSGGRAPLLLMPSLKIVNPCAEGQ